MLCFKKLFCFFSGEVASSISVRSHLSVGLSSRSPRSTSGLCWSLLPGRDGWTQSTPRCHLSDWISSSEGDDRRTPFRVRCGRMPLLSKCDQMTSYLPHNRMPECLHSSFTVVCREQNLVLNGFIFRSLNSSTNSTVDIWLVLCSWLRIWPMLLASTSGL